MRNLLVPSQAVFNPTMNYVRVFCGFSIMEEIAKRDKEQLYNFFDSYITLIELGSKLVLDISTEAEDITIVLQENNKEYILDWILDYTIDRNFRKDQFEIWVSDFNCKKNINKKK